MRVAVMNSPKSSAATTPKLTACRPQRSTVATAAPMRPMIPSGPMGIRSPGARNASAVMAAMAAAVTQAIGTIAARAENILGPRLPRRHDTLGLHRRATPHLVKHAFDRGFHRLEEQIRQHAHENRERDHRYQDGPLPRL